MNGLLSMLLKASLTASVMIGVLFVMRPLISGKIHPVMMTFLWTLVLIRLCLPVTLESPVTLAHWLPAQSREALPAETAQPVDAPSETGTGVPTGTQTTNRTPDTTLWQTNNTAAPVAAPASASVLRRIGGWLKGISLSSLLIAVWALGACLMLGSFTVRAVRFRYRLRQCNQVACGEIFELTDRYRKELGIRRRIWVLQCDFIRTPAVFGYFKPCILVPAAFVEGIRAGRHRGILIHELCHIRRHDILSGYGWLAAKALHWFNPLVWMAFRQMQDDAEMCCDHQVVRILGEGEALNYSQSLIDASRMAGGSPAPVAAASLFGKKSRLEGRILQMIKPRRRSKGAAALSAVTACLLFVTCFTTACQATPEDPAVVQKDSDKLSQLIEQTDAPAEYDFPGTVTDRIESAGLSVVIDAKVVVPDTASIPVVRAEAVDLTQQQADLILGELVADALLVSLRDADAAQITKDDIIAQIARLQAMLEDSDATQEQSIRAQISQLQQQLDAAPSEVDIPYSDKVFTRPLNPEDNTVLTEEEKAGMTKEEQALVEKEMSEARENAGKPANFQTIEGTCDLGKDRDARISIYRYDNPIFSFVRFNNQDSKSTVMDSPEYAREITADTPIGNLEISGGQAYQEALDALADMDIQGMTLAKTAMVPLGDPQVSASQWPFCYMFVFTRTIGGVPCTYALAEGTGQDQMGEVWSQEYITICIDDSGIVDFSWEAPTRAGETVNDHVSLKSFDEIMAVFRQQADNRYVYDDDPDIIAREIHIDEITLGMMKIKMADGSGYMYVPVWDFFGYSVNTYNGNTQLIVDGNGQKTMDRFGASFLTINAIDGTVIDRSLGY